MSREYTFATVRDWYWRADDGRIFSSAREACVPPDDPAFAAWCGDGTEPTPWPREVDGTQTDAALETVLAPYGLHATLFFLKRALLAEVDTRAETLRLAHVTPGAGQAMEYQETQAQAFAALAAAASGKGLALDDYPMLAATIGLDLDPSTGKVATDVLGVARSVQASYDAWLKIAAPIRRVRLAGKAAIAGAADAASARAACAAVAWPTVA